jgi:hypothetical protein
LIHNKITPVFDDVKSIAGKIRLLAIFIFNCNSMLPVPLNSSKITSFFEPVSSMQLYVLKDPPFSTTLAGPKNRFVALESTPQFRTLPDAGCTVL